MFHGDGRMMGVVEVVFGINLSIIEHYLSGYYSELDSFEELVSQLACGGVLPVARARERESGMFMKTSKWL